MSNSKNKRIQVLITEDNFEKLQDIAQKNGLRISDLVKEAIQRQVKELGYEIDLRVNTWGGRRERSGRKKYSDTETD